MSDWRQIFEKVSQWVLLGLFLFGFCLSLVIVGADVVTSYYGWGVIIERLNPVLGSVLSVALSLLPTLIQLIFWAGWTAKSDIMKHGYFKLLFLIMLVTDTVADLICFSFFDSILAGQLGDAGMSALTVLGGFGVLSEFMFLFCGSGTITQATTLKLFSGFDSTQQRPGLGPSIGGFVRGESPSMQMPGDVPRSGGLSGPPDAGPHIPVISRPSRATHFPMGGKGWKP